MFEINKENLEQKQAEHEAKKMLAKMMSQMILESETASESMKLNVCILDKAQDLQDSLHDVVNRYVKPGNRANAETLKTVLEYLSLVEVGVKQFLETTPFVADEEDDDDGNN